jgi:hypothetical protein
MQSTLQLASPLVEGNGQKTARQRGDLVYQVMTIAAMLIVLVSVWVF